MVAIAGGRSIRCAQYATYGTRELALNAVEALRDRRACLLANHGSIALGDSIEAASSPMLTVNATRAAMDCAVRSPSNLARSAA